MECALIRIHPWEKSHQPTKIKHSRLTEQIKEIKKYICQLKTKLKQKMENKTRARCQVENKAKKTKLTNMLRGKERKKRKKE